MSYALMCLMASSARLLQMVGGDPWSLKAVVCQSNGVVEISQRDAAFSSKEDHLGKEAHIVFREEKSSLSNGYNQ